MKRILMLLLVLVLVASLSVFAGIGCKAEEKVSEEVSTEEEVVTEEEVTETAEDEDILVALCLPALDQQWYWWLEKGAKDKAAELGVEVVVTDAKYDSDKMLNDFRDVIAMGAKAAATIVTESAIGPAVKEICDEAGIILIASDDPIEGALYLGADNFWCGEIGGEWAADYIIENYNGGVNIDEIPLIIAMTMPEYASVIERSKGQLSPLIEKVPAFKDYELEDLFNNVHKDVVVVYNDGMTQAESESIFADVITANPRDEYIVLVGGDDWGAGGATLALEAAGLDENSVVVGMSGSGETYIRMIADPDTCFYATTSFFPEKQAAALVDAMVRGIKGEKLTNENIAYNEHAITTKENVKEQYPDLFEE